MAPVKIGTPAFSRRKENIMAPVARAPIATTPAFSRRKVRPCFYDLQMTNTNMSTDPEVVYREIQAILGSYFFGMPLSANWSHLERSYRLKFKRSLDYQCLGVTTLNELLDRMGKMVVKFKNLERNKEYVMSAPLVETRRNVYLMHDVRKLFNRHCGEIKFDSFEDLFKEHVGHKLDYHFYGLTDLDHLCEVLKDNLEVELDRTGEKVIKAVKCYNLRKRKHWML